LLPLRLQLLPSTLQYNISACGLLKKFTEEEVLNPIAIPPKTNTKIKNEIAFFIHYLFTSGGISFAISGYNFSTLPHPASTSIVALSFMASAFISDALTRLSETLT